MGKKIDWTKIRLEYITSDPPVSYEELSRKHDVSLSTVEKRASRENWSGRKKEYGRRLEAKTLELTSSDVAKERMTQLKIGKALIGKGLEKLETAEPIDFKEAMTAVVEGSRIIRFLLPSMVLKTPPQAEEEEIDSVFGPWYIKAIRHLAPEILKEEFREEGSELAFIEEKREEEAEKEQS